ncbi:MAG: hypothetical protein ACXADY_16150 [Candidatus Hodarchaeales archaeon]
MLLLPDKKIWRYQVTLILVLATTLSTMLLVFYLPPITRNDERISNNGEQLFSDEIQAGSYTDALFYFLQMVVCLLIFIIGLLILIESLFYWVPSLTDVTENENKGKMIWQKTQLWFPERVFSISDANTRILIRRNRSSLAGLLMKEFTMEIYIDKNIPEIKQISDFTSIEKMIQTPSYKILIKTIKLKFLPLQLIQIRTIIALMSTPF